MEFLFAASAMVLAACTGWLARGTFESLKTRATRRAWRRARHFLPSDTTKT